MAGAVAGTLEAECLYKPIPVISLTAEPSWVKSSVTLSVNKEQSYFRVSRQPAERRGVQPVQRGITLHTHDDERTLEHGAQTAF